MECSKCKRELAFYGSSAICRCKDCQQSFCENEGDILDKNKLVEVARGKTDRIIYDFRCYDCKEKEEVRKEALKETNERLAKQQEERERADMLKAQMLHSSDNWEVEFEETEKLPEIGEINSIKRGFRGIIRPCSVYDRFYGSKWPAIDTRIFLTFTHYKESDGRLLWEKTEYYCLLCYKRFLKEWWGDLEHDFLINRRSRTFKEKFPDIEFDKK